MAGETILLVDDQAFIRHIYSTDLRNAGYTVLTAESGKSALELLTNDRVDLVLLDGMMPGIDGYETCTRIRANPATKQIPVVFLTANADKKSVIKAVQVGGNDFFVKGPDISPLLAKLEKVLASKGGT
jgi:CheY-like chemotaxis protein